MSGILQRPQSNAQGGKSSWLIKYSDWNIFKTPEDNARSVRWGISSPRWSVLTFFTVELDRTWRFVAVPLQCPEPRGHLGCGALVNMDRLHPTSSQAADALRVNQKLQKRPPGGGSYITQPIVNRKSSKSDVTSQSHKEALPNEPLNKYTMSNKDRISSTSNYYPGLLPSNHHADDSAVVLTESSKADKATRKNSRKKARKKGKQRKMISSNGDSREVEGLSKECDHGSSASRAYDRDVMTGSEGAVSCATASGLLLTASTANENSIDWGKSEGINCSEAPKVHIFRTYEAATLESGVTSSVHDIYEECLMFNSQDGYTGSNAKVSTVDGVEDVNIRLDFCPRWTSSNDFLKGNSSLELDVISASSTDDGCFRIERTVYDKKCCGISHAKQPTSGFTKEYFSEKESIMDVKLSGSSTSMLLGISCNKDGKTKSKSNSSSSSRMRSVGNFNGQSGKEHCHPVWQKVRQKRDHEGVNELTNYPVNSQIEVHWRQSSFMKQNSKASKVNMEFRSENSNQSKLKLSGKSNRKSCFGSRPKADCYSTKGPSTNKIKLEKSRSSAKLGPSRNKKTMASQATIRSTWEIVSKCGSQNASPILCLEKSGDECLDAHLEDGCHLLTCQLEMPKSICNDALVLENETRKKEDSTLAEGNAKSHDINNLKQQSPVSDEVSRIEKEVSAAECSEKNFSSGSTVQKWVPVCMKNPPLTKPCKGNSFHSDASAEEKSCALSEDNIGLADAIDVRIGSLCRGHESKCVNGLSCEDGVQVELEPVTDQSSNMLEEQNKLLASSYSSEESENQNNSIIQINSDKITKAMEEAYRIQLQSEAVHLLTGGPIAEFERLLHISSPAVCPSHAIVSCSTCQRHQVAGSLLCQHERPNIPLQCLWQWYKKHTSYGLEHRGRDFNSNRLGGDRFSFRAYFVPSLSAMQLFKISKSKAVQGFNDAPRPEKTVGSGLPIYSLLVPQPWNGGTDNFRRASKVSTCPSSPTFENYVCGAPTGDKQFKDLEVLFEYFEVEQPQQRQPLYEKIQELVGGYVPSRCRSYGDPSKLNSINLRDLDPRSWYSVAWYPIYRIPDGNLRAAFLTYHSLGNLVRREFNFDSVDVNPSIVTPVVGLQSYNAQSECWFQLKPSAINRSPELSSLDPSKILKDRLRTLEEVASQMATAVVTKGDCSIGNRHPDYEFFLSRRY